MWTPTTREQHSRTAARYETDLTDAEWAILAPHMPPPANRGRPRDWTFREIINGIFYVLRGGIPWRLMPTDLPPWPTVYRWFAAWRDDGLFETINHALVMSDRERVGCEASPSAAIVDSQSVKTTESGGPRGYDAGKKVKGRKRHALVDTDGRALLLFAHPADIQSLPPRRRGIGTPPVLCSASPAASGPSSRRPSPTAPMTPSALRPPPMLRSRSCASAPIRSASSSSRAPHPELVEGWVVERFFVDQSQPAPGQG